jgi:hypothetical protein
MTTRRSSTRGYKTKAVRNCGQACRQAADESGADLVAEGGTASRGGGDLEWLRPEIEQTRTAIADGEMEAGRHRLAFDGRSLASGVYVVRATVEAGQGQEVQALMQRITLVR